MQSTIDGRSCHNIYCSLKLSALLSASPSEHFPMSSPPKLQY
jgi:hypothetical protein